jgi:ribosome-binding factor A
MATIPWRFEHIKGQLIREISWTIAQKVNDPRIPEVVTITEVKLAQDTRNATVNVSILGDAGQKEKAIAALNHAASFIQKCVAAKVTMRNFPKLYFKLDSAFDKSENINEILKKIHDDLV